MRTMPILLAFAALPSLTACAELNQFVQQTNATQVLAPQVQASPPQLRRAPGLRDLAAYYCPVVIDNPIARLACATVLGPPPTQDRLVFEFGVHLTLKNPNDVPIPALDVLLALTLFPGQDAEALGAICVSLCGGGDPACTGAPRPGACTSSQSDIRRIEDFAARVPGLIAALASGQAQQALRQSTIVARGDANLDLAFDLGIDQALRVLQKTANRFVQTMLNGGSYSLEVPVSGTGTVFVNLPGLGRLGVGFGPLQSVWRII